MKGQVSEACLGFIRRSGGGGGGGELQHLAILMATPTSSLHFIYQV